METLIAVLFSSALACLMLAGLLARWTRGMDLIEAIGWDPSTATSASAEDRGGGRWSRGLTGRWGRAVLSVSAALIAGLIGFRLAGPLGLVVSALAAAWLPFGWRRRSHRRRSEVLELQLADLVETMAMALRSGLSLGQALDYAATEMEDPLASLLNRMIAERRLGRPFDAALASFGRAIGTEDARLFILVVTIHARSGGDLANALDEVARTLRQRISVRRELRALTAQGRLSGVILGSVPLVFFLFLAATSQRELAPIYRSPAGMAMISTGLVLEGLAFLWIRRLLKVEI
ncbi:type II secretion system F family protein [soil metagenome]